MVKYDTPMHGQSNIASVREQIQEDIISYLESTPSVPSWPKEMWADELCEIVVQNFKKLE